MAKTQTVPQIHPFEPKGIQTEIVKRFMSDTQYRSFLGNYRKHRKTLRVRRDELLSKEVSEKEHQALYAYLNEFETTVADIGRKFGFPQKNVHGVLMRAAARLLYQNKSKLGF